MERKIRVGVAQTIHFCIKRREDADVDGEHALAFPNLPDFLESSNQRLAPTDPSLEVL